MKDLDLAERALDAVVDHLRRRAEGLSRASEIEYARNMSNLAHAKAQLCLQDGDAASAQTHIDRA